MALEIYPALIPPYNALHPMFKKLLHALGPLIGVALLALALFVLYNKLKIYSPRFLLHSIQQIPPKQVALAIVLASLNYLVLTTYDFLACQYVGAQLRYPKVAFTSFVSYAFGHNVGISALSGGSIRYRLYSCAGISLAQIARIIAFTGLTFLVGYFTIASIAFTLHSIPISAPFLPLRTTLPLGIMCIILVVGYLGLNSARTASVRFLWWNLPPFSWKFVGAQMLVGSLEPMLAAGVLFVLLPQHPAIIYETILVTFLFAQFAGILSQVPGGIGVFETVFSVLLAPFVPEKEIIGSLLVYRAIYYILPLIVAVVMMFIHEINDRQRRRRYAQRMKYQPRRAAFNHTTVQ